MTVSTDAILFYGYHLDEDAADVEALVEVLELDGAGEPVRVGQHCSDESPMQ